MNKHVNALCKPNQVLGDARVSRQHDRMATVVDSVAECGRHETVINQKRGHLHTLFVKDDAFLDVMAHHLDAVTRRCFSSTSRRM